MAKRFDSASSAFLRCFFGRFFGFYLCVASSPALAFEFLTANGAHQFGGLIGIPAARFSTRLSNLNLQTTAAPGQASLTRGPLVSLSVQSDYSNIFVGGSRDGQSLILDGETARTGASVVLQAGRCWQFAADLQQVTHSGGSLDSSIEQWHRFFQMPEARRSETERDRLKFFLETDTDGSSFSLEEGVASLGDTVVQFAYRSECGIAGSPIAGELWFAGVKLPTGTYKKLSGSGGTDVFFGLQTGSVPIGKRLSAGTRVGVLIPEQADLTPTVSPAVVFATAGLQWQPSWLQAWRMQLLMQLDMHSPLYESSLRELGNYTAQLGIGARLRPAIAHEITLALLEDVAIDTTPDLVIHLQYRYKR